MEHNRLLTIAIPTYDRKTLLRETLQSIAHQTWSDFLVILFDNASPYDITTLTNEFPSLMIEVIRNPENIGNQANFAKVLAHTYTTPYVMVFHDDDTIHPRYLEVAMTVLRNDSQLQWVGSVVRSVRHANGMMRFSEKPLNDMSTYSQTELTDALINGLTLGFSSVIYRTTAVARIAPRIDTYFKWFDRPFMIDACGNGRVGVFDFPYINYRIHVSQDSVQTYREHITPMMNLIAYYFEKSSKTRAAARFTTTSALRAAATNARSLREFQTILASFSERGLFRVRDLSINALYWAVRIFAKRIYRFFATK